MVKFVLFRFFDWVSVMQKNGIFIAIEGLDGVGKTTACRLVSQKLGFENGERFGSEISDLIKNLSRQGPIDKNVLHLIYATKLQLVGNKLTQMMQEGKSAVVDRYWLSNKYYPDALYTDFKLATANVDVPKPDITFVLTASEEKRLERMGSKGRAQDSDEEKLNDPNVRKKILDNFMKHRVHIIDTSNMSAEEVADEIVKITNLHLQQKNLLKQSGKPKSPEN